MNEKELREIYIVQDLLKGCICRMCVTDNEKEFNSMYEFAKSYLQKLYIINKSRFDID